MNPYVVLDVFTDTPLEGNPVAIFTEADATDSRLMQRIARELNLSETVFLFADNRVRIFTPSVEMPFAGHPVLGTAFYLHDRDGVEAVRLLTGAGPIDVVVSDGYGEMSQPLPTWRAFPDPQAVLDAVGVSESALPIEIYDNGVQHAYVAVDDVATLSALKPDHNAVAKLGPLGINCFALTGPASARTRMFGIALGVVEDPATGSAAGPLAVHLARHGRLGFGETATITQGVEIGRPSTLKATAYGSAEQLERVAVGGSAVLVARGEYNLG